MTVQEASEGDSATLPATLDVEAVQPPARSKRWSPTRGPQRRWWRRLGFALRRRCWRQEDGRDAGGEACCAEGTIWEPSAYSRRPRPSSSTWWSGLSRPVVRRVWVRGHRKVSSRRPVATSLLLRRLTGVGTPEPAGAGSFGYLRTDRSPERALGASDGLLGLPMDAGGAAKLPEQVGSANRLLPRAAEGHRREPSRPPPRLRTRPAPPDRATGGADRTPIRAAVPARTRRGCAPCATRGRRCPPG